MPLDAYESPAQACAQSAQSDNLHGIVVATMRCIVKDPQCTVQTFFAGGSLFFSRRSLQGNPVPRREPRHGFARNPKVPHPRSGLRTGTVWDWLLRALKDIIRK
jgi:hypothetical protein